jgi:hypothetical protein
LKFQIEPEVVMARVCKNCGVENRDLAQFCSGCGVPLPKVTRADEKTLREAQQRAKRFWNYVFAGIAAAAIAGYAALSFLSDRAKEETLEKYQDAYLYTDRNLFAGLSGTPFTLLGLSWDMKSSDIMAAYPGTTAENDPDFKSTLMVKPEPQGFNHKGKSEKLPHAGFMNLGIYRDRLYAIKFEFTETPEPISQMIKVSNKEYILFGRYLGLRKTFTQIMGYPARINDPAKTTDLVRKVKEITADTAPTGPKKNIFIYWETGETRTEIAVFAIKNKRGEDELKLTVRFFYLPVYKRLGGL